MRIGTSVVAIGVLVLAGYLLVGATQQVVQPVGAGPLKPMYLGINPEEIVNLDSASLDPVTLQGPILLPGAELTLFTVPSNRWLIVMNCSSVSDHCQLEEIAGTDVTIKRGWFFMSGFVDHQFNFISATGLTFAPGSRVVLRSIGAAPTQATYSMSGFMLPG